MELLHLYRQEYLPLRPKCRSVKSKGEYEAAIANLRKYLRSLPENPGREPTVADLTKHTIARLGRWMFDNERSPATINKTLRHLRSLWRFAVSEKFTAETPAVEWYEELDRNPRAWPIDDFRTLVITAHATPGMVDQHPSGDFFGALFRFAFDTGLRKSAILRLKPQHVDLKARTVFVPANLQKHRADQICTISAETAEALGKIFDPKSPWLFMWPFDRYPNSSWTALNRKLRDIVKRAGLSNDCGLLQRVRRTTATYVEVNGGDATQAMGHSRRSITEHSYIDRTLAPVKSASDYLPRISLPPN